MQVYKFGGASIKSSSAIRDLLEILIANGDNKVIVFSAMGQTFITALLISAAIIVVFLLLFRSWNKAAIHSSVALLLFCSCFGLSLR